VRESGLPARAFLRNGYDYSDAQLFTAQRRGDLLAAVNFGTDGGNTHIASTASRTPLHRQGPRLRFEFGGAAAAQKPPTPAAPDDGITARFGHLRVGIAVPVCAFETSTPPGGAGRTAQRSWLDLVLYSGDDRDFDLTRWETAALGFTLRVSTAEDAPTARRDRVPLRWPSHARVGPAPHLRARAARRGLQTPKSGDVLKGRPARIGLHLDYGDRGRCPARGRQNDRLAW
jgi:hypothetical protein